MGTDEKAQAQGASTWNLYMKGNVIFFGSVWLALPITLKAVGLSAVMTARLPSIIGWCIDVLIQLLSIFLAVALMMQLYLFSTTGQVDSTFFGPIPVSA